MMLFIALTGGLLAVLFGSMWAIGLAEKVDQHRARAVSAEAVLRDSINDLDQRLKEAHRLATKAHLEADNALTSVGALSQRFDQHRTSLEAHKRLKR